MNTYMIHHYDTRSRPTDSYKEIQADSAHDALERYSPDIFRMADESTSIRRADYWQGRPGVSDPAMAAEDNAHIQPHIDGMFGIQAYRIK